MSGSYDNFARIAFFILSISTRTAAGLAHQLQVHEAALYPILRALASQGVFEETSSYTFANTSLSSFRCTGVPGSIRSILIFKGSEFNYLPFGEILHSVQTGKPAREKVYGSNVFEHLQHHPEMARAFDDAMTNFSELLGPAIAAAYDFGAWGV